jgi:hypothetical protein
MQEDMHSLSQALARLLVSRGECERAGKVLAVDKLSTPADLVRMLYPTKAVTALTISNYEII